MSNATLHPVRGALRRMLVGLCALGLVGLAAPATASAYGWPVKPFHVQHPVRGAFGDPRIGDGPGGGQSFHFGIDICAANGTPVYATVSGRVSIHPLHRDTVVVTSGGRELSYWHVVPSVSAGSYVRAYATVIGHVEAPWAHVHLSEARGGVYVNPLRRGALAPYADHTKPIVEAVGFERAGRGIGRVLRGPTDLVAQVADPHALRVPDRWRGKPVVPALVRWRVARVGRRASAWHTAADFRYALPTCAFSAVYAVWTRQNKPWRRGRYRVLLAPSWNAPGAGTYRLDVLVADTRGNSTVSAVSFTVA
jgi:hypothetical protein